MEQLQVLSKSYLVRWVQASVGTTISWNIHPHKHSLNFGIFRQPANSTGKRPVSASAATPAIAPSNGHDHITRSTAQITLESLGHITIIPPFSCPADVNTTGKYDVADGGNYALVFDNTFSKQLAKTVTFVMFVYETGAPPKSIISDSLGTSPPGPVSNSDAKRPRSRRAGDRSVRALETSTGTVYTGFMNKKRRKHNTYAKRYFSLDTNTGTLSYYRNRQSSALRGAMSLSLGVVGVDDQTREISLDDGAQIWHLKAGTAKDFEEWKSALEKVSSLAARNAAAFMAGPSGTSESGSASASAAFTKNTALEEREWVQVEALVSHLAGIRDAVRRLAKDTDPKYLLLPPSIDPYASGPARSPSVASFDSSVKEDDRSIDQPKRPFWKRKASTPVPPTATASSSVFKRSISAQQASTLGNAAHLSPAKTSTHAGKQPALSQLMNDGIHENCMQIMHDLNQTVAHFSQLLTNSKQRRRPQSMAILSPHGLSRHSTSGSMSEEEFFDAHEGESAISRSQLLEIRRDSQDMDAARSVVADDGASSSEEDNAASPDGDAHFRRRRTIDEETSLFPRKPKSLTPLPVSTAVTRRTTVPPPKVPPPSLIAFLRKNVGKDLSTIAMPVSANEPLSALQRISEQLEYTALMDAAAAEQDPIMRLLYLSAFAVSSFSNNRAKERAIRKPFNPMLGETFELVREDLGYRLLAEKICHRPVRMAMQAESNRNGGWTWFQCATPTQKFWGKSAELNTEGRARIMLHTFGEVYGYSFPTSFLRNVLAGEKYVEPVSTMTVECETSGFKAVVAFKASGMFAGRSEEVSVQCYDNTGCLLPVGLAGKWTSSLKMMTKGDDRDRDPAWRVADGTKAIWNAGELASGGGGKYGFTLFAAQLNETTEMEKGKLPPTDSRLRPDQHALEDGQVDDAEEIKGKLEEEQRARRKEIEEQGLEWTPKWFVQSGEEAGESVWKMKGGKEGYWDARDKGDWKDIVNIFKY